MNTQILKYKQRQLKTGQMPKENPKELNKTVLKISEERKAVVFDKKWNSR